MGREQDQSGEEMYIDQGICQYKLIFPVGFGLVITMSKFRARYEGSSEEFELEGESLRKAYVSFIETGEAKDQAIELWNNFSWVRFDEHIAEQVNEEKEKIEKDNIEKRKQLAIDLKNKINKEGFKSLNPKQMLYIAETWEQFTQDEKLLFAEEQYLVTTSIADNVAFNFLSLWSITKNANLMESLLGINAGSNEKLSNISQNTKSSYMATLPTGVLASRLLGRNLNQDIEEIKDDVEDLNEEVGDISESLSEF